MPTIVVEDDVVIRSLQVVLDPDTDPERQAAIADYLSVDVPDFDGWRDRVRAAFPAVCPSRVINVSTQEELLAALAHADGVVVEELLVGECELAAAPKLRIVQCFRSDIRNIDVAACAARGIVVKPMHRRVNIAVAEHAFALMLAAARKLGLVNKRLTFESLEEAGFHPKMYDRTHSANANWARISGIRTLWGSTFGAIGLGSIGREVAKRATAFGMEVLYYQRSRLDAAIEQECGARYVPLHELLERSDFISLHLPMNATTEGLLDADCFAHMKQGAILINISRAHVIDREALMEAMNAGRLGGLGLDVHYEEPSDPDEPLLAFDNAILTPHIAVGDRRRGTEDLEELVANLAAAIG